MSEEEQDDPELLVSCLGGVAIAMCVAPLAYAASESWLATGLAWWVAGSTSNRLLLGAAGWRMKWVRPSTGREL